MSYNYYNVISLYQLKNNKIIIFLFKMNYEQNTNNFNLL